MTSFKKTIIFIFIIFISCKSKSYLFLNNNQAINSSVKKNKNLTSQEWKFWFHKDVKKDTILGISLDKAYAELLKDKRADTLIVALIDGRIDTSHEDIKNTLWINKSEIANNGIDDDANGYIDDIHGWNFLGNKNGRQLYRASFEYTRILRQYDSLFKDKIQLKIPSKHKNKYISYQRALKAYNRRLKITYENIIYLDSLMLLESQIREELTSMFPNTEFNENNLDSISLKNEMIKNKISDFKSLLKNSNWVNNRLQSEKRYLTIYLNKNHNDRKIINDKPHLLDDINYGNNKIGIDFSDARHSHGIKMIGAIAADRKNNKGIKGITNLVKIMPLAVAPYGDTHDKDIALAIRYAVDNGAKIINMSIGRSFSLYEDWVYDAIKYAEKNDVIIITSSGNEGLDLDINYNYPNDSKNHRKEFVKNFLKVGSSQHTIDSLVVSSFSNYGKNEVDIFAPGKFIYTTFNDNKYDYDSGTSLSSVIVSGIASLIRSYYPTLSASEVKEIIMDSGVKLNIMVNKPSTSKEKELVPFSSLSKSGKIVNAYNALLLAEEVSKKKKK